MGLLRKAAAFVSFSDETHDRNSAAVSAQSVPLPSRSHLPFACLPPLRRYNEGGMPPYLGENLSFANSFQQVVRDVALNLPTKAQPRSAVYSSACFLHCTSTLAWGAFWGVKVDGLALKDYLGA